MDSISKRLEVYIKSHRFDSVTSEYETVLDQLYHAYAKSHESARPEISEGVKELGDFLCTLPLDDNNAVFNLCCRLCSAYEHKAFLDGLQYGAHLKSELFRLDTECFSCYARLWRLNITYKFIG